MTHQMNQQRTFGIEIEFIGSRNDAHRAIRSKGIACEVEGYNHRTVSYWKLTTDASVDNGYELVSPVLQGDAGLADLKKVCEALAEANCTVNRSCGLHIHLDAGSEFSAIKNFTKLYIKHEEALDSIMPPSRRGSGAQYVRSNLQRHNSMEQALTQLNRAGTMEELSSAVCSRNRYHKLNTESYWNYGTIEVRHHSGSVEYEKISNWILLLQGMFDTAEECSQVRPQGSQLANVLKYAKSRKVTNFYKKRAAQFAAA